MKIVADLESTRVKGVSFHTTKPWLACAMYDGTIVLRELESPHSIRTFQAHDGPVRSVCFHPTLDIIASGGDDGKVKVWDVEMLKCTQTLSHDTGQPHGSTRLGWLLPEKAFVRSVAFNSQGTLLLSAGDEFTAKIWDWRTEKCLVVLDRHTHCVMQACFHPTKPLIATAGLDFFARLWDYTDMATNESPSMIESLLFFFDRKGVKQVKIVENWRDAEPQTWWNKFFKTYDSGALLGISFSKNNEVVVCGEQGRLGIWNLAEDSIRVLHHLHTADVVAAIFHPTDENILLSADISGCINAFNLKDETTQNIQKTRFWCLAANSTGTLFAAGHDQGIVLFSC